VQGNWTVFAVRSVGLVAGVQVELLPRVGSVPAAAASAFATAEPPARLSSVSPDCTSSGVILIVKAR
jgi:hypothetical protein